MGRNRFRHDTSCANHRSFSDFDTGQHYYVGSYPHVIAHLYRLCSHHSGIALLHRQRVGDGDERAVRTNHYVVAYLDIRLIENSQIEISNKIIANPDIKSEVAAERTVDDKTLANLSQERFQQTVPLVGLRWRQHIDFVAQFGTPAESVGHIGTVLCRGADPQTLIKSLEKRFEVHRSSIFTLQNNGFFPIHTKSNHVRRLTLTIIASRCLQLPFPAKTARFRLFYASQSPIV